MSDRKLSRRDLLTFWRRAEAAPAAPEPPEPPEPPERPGLAEPAPPPAPPPLATAEIDWEVCLAYRGVACDACTVACPEPGAIRVDPHGHPRVDIYRCTGCGACEPVCPTDPKAIRL